MNFRQNGDKYLITIEVIALIVVLVFGAVHFVMPGNNANKKITESQQYSLDTESYSGDEWNSAGTS